MNLASHTIFIMDDDAAVCAALNLILTGAGYDVICFSDSQSLLAAAHARVPACVLIDLLAPGSWGLDVLKQLQPSHYPAPVLLTSGRSLVLPAVDAIKTGSYDFIEKPFTGEVLVERIERARRDFSVRRAAAGLPSRQPVPVGIEPLTLREHEVLALWVAGSTSKEIARKFGISYRTIEIHRSRIMKKMHAKNSAEIVKIAMSNSAALGIYRKIG